MSKNPNNRALTVSQKVYALLLPAYPKAHREQYGPAMAQLFRDQCRDAWNESQYLGVIKLWLHVLPDLLKTSFIERLTTLNKRKFMSDKTTTLIQPRTIFLKVFVVVFLIIVCMTVTVTFLLPETYASTARIKVEPDVKPLGGYYNATNFLQMTVGMIQSEHVLNPVIDKLRLNTIWGKKYNGGKPLETTNTLALLKSRISLAPEQNTKLIDIAVYSEDKIEAAQIANAIAQSYQDYRIKSHAELVAVEIHAQQQSKKKEEDQIAVLQSSVEQLRQKLKITDQDPQATAPSSAMTRQEWPYWEKKRDLINMIEFFKKLQAINEAEKLDIQIPNTSMAEIVDTAKPGDAPVRPNKPFNIVLGAGIGILLALVVGGIAALIALLIRKRTRKIPVTT